MSTYGTPATDFRDPANPDALCECDNCGLQCASHKLRPVQSPDERIDENGPNPEGECPECGCLSYIVAGAEEDQQEIVAQAYRDEVAETYDVDRVKVEPDAEVSVDHDGAWVAAWVFIPKKD